MSVRAHREDAAKPLLDYRKELAWRLQGRRRELQNLTERVETYRLMAELKQEIDSITSQFRMVKVPK